MNEIDTSKKAKLGKLIRKEFIRTNRPLIYIGLGLASVAILYVAALSDEYVCSNDMLRGSVTSLAMTKDALYQTLNMHASAVVKVQDGPIIYLDTDRLVIGQAT